MLWRLLGGCMRERRVYGAPGVLCELPRGALRLRLHRPYLLRRAGWDSSDRELRDELHIGDAP